MKIAMRWFGPSNPVSLQGIAQVPGVSGILQVVNLCLLKHLE